MMWKEFEELAGYEVTYEDYTNVIEPMYMALPDGITKQQFVKMLDKKAFALPTKAEMKRKIRKIAGFLFENCGASSFIKENEQIHELANEYAKRFYGEGAWAIETRDYAYYGVQTDRGCTYPQDMYIYDSKDNLIETVVLVG